MVNVTLMFKNVRLYFAMAYVTRTNFDICRCWTILFIHKGLHYIDCLTTNYDKETASPKEDISSICKIKFYMI